jgi:hypothetical protein
MKRRRALVATALMLVALRARTAPIALEAERIERLIRYVETQQQLKFVRNGTAYAAKDAATFLRAKLDRMGGQVSTAQQFIEQIASRSSTSGEPYLIRFGDGRTVPAAQFLGDELKRMDKQP